MLTEDQIKEKLKEIDKLYPGAVTHPHRAFELLGLQFGLLTVLEKLNERDWTQYINHLREKT